MRRSVAISLRPIVWVATDAEGVEDVLVEALRARYDDVYMVLTADERTLPSAEDDVALVLFVQTRDGTHGGELLERSWRLDRDARRVLLTAHADAESAMMSVNQPFVNHYLVMPWAPASERLFPVLDDQLDEWRASVRHPYMRVKGVMSARPVRIREHESILRAAEMVAMSGATDLMVVSAEGAFAGVLSVGDILRAAMPDVDDVMAEGGSLDVAFQLFLRRGSDLAERSIAPLVIREPTVADPDDHVAKVATVLLEKGIGRMPVVRDGRLVGTVSRADVCQAIVGAL